MEKKSKWYFLGVIASFSLLVFTGNMDDAFGQLVITGNDNPNDLANTILGGGITLVGTPTLLGCNQTTTICPNNVLQTGTFTGGTPTVGFENGIVLHTGDVQQIPGPNANPPETRGGQDGGPNDVEVNLGTGITDADNELVGGDLSFDSAVLTFSFQFGDGSEGGDLNFNTKFASEEYHDFIDSSFNDAFTFMLDGVNIATIGPDPISINSVNDMVNSAFYIGNVDDIDGNIPNANLDISFDGLTAVLNIQALGLGPGTHTIKLAVSDIGDEVFDAGVFIQANSFSAMMDDFGDAPDPTYPTLLPTGASHAVGGPLFLGAQIDFEPNGQPNGGATGDDNAGVNDEDGVMHTSALVTGEMATVDVTVAGNNPGLLNAWVDFNDDGDWTDPGEQIFTNTNVNPGPNMLSFPVPATATPTNLTFERYRLDSGGNLSPTGAAADGEVEDYPIEISGEDFGDAPDSYDTVRSSNGARHVLAGSPILGLFADAEPDANFPLDGTGDDVTGTADEDGVMFTSALVQGQAVTVDVTASAPTVLNAWVDFDDDGSFAEAGDQIFTDVNLNAGVNNLGFNVPGDAALGDTFSRFRVNINGGISFNGFAPDGEVEDYKVTIAAPAANCGNGVVDAGEDCDPTNPSAATCCDASTCMFKSSVTVCRPASTVDLCDAAETCTGISEICPADDPATSGTECRASEGACDPAETCDGQSFSCPGDVLATSGTECREADGVCDVAESCDGTSAECPVDGFADNTVSCEDGNQCTGPDMCDGAGGCAAGPPVDIEACFPAEQPVGGEFLPIDSTALFVSGVSANMGLIVPIVAGIAGASAYYIKTRMSKE